MNNQKWILEIINQDGFDFYYVEYDNLTQAEMSKFFEMQEFINMGLPNNDFFNVFTIYTFNENEEEKVVSREVLGIDVDDVDELWLALALMDFNDY